ncbi:hypothetical protein [Dyella subtropica]|uniref:hypothetical protein n=1 Tax=Dyella subtropica TaxID=2992127 RepID=UPI00224D2F13|nr:hypothetical protein [Dyella subtropica]
MAMNVPTNANGPDKFPSGNWTYGPLKINWDIKDLDAVDVDVSVFGFDIDKLSGTLKAGDAELEEGLDIAGLANGDIKLQAKWDQTPADNGLWIYGEIQAGPWKSGDMKHRLVAW